MKFDPDHAIAVLSQTPATLRSLLGNLPSDWIEGNEGPETWNPYDVIGHLIHGEKTDWIPRMEIILSDGANRKFEPFDRFAQFENSRGKPLQQLLDELEALRKENIEKLRAKNLHATDLMRTGIHPAFGEVTLAQLLATWVVHDLDHVAQIARVMAKQYKAEVGSWVEYLKILRW